MGPPIYSASVGFFAGKKRKKNIHHVKGPLWGGQAFPAYPRVQKKKKKKKIENRGTKFREVGGGGTNLQATQFGGKKDLKKLKRG